MNTNFISISRRVSAVAGWKFGPKTFVDMSGRDELANLVIESKEEINPSATITEELQHDTRNMIDSYIETNAKASSMISFWMINQCSIAGFSESIFC